MNKTITQTVLSGVEETATYRFQTVWWTPAAIEKVWEILAHYSAWTT